MNSYFWINIIYILSAAAFIWGLKMMSHLMLGPMSLWLMLESERI